MAPEDREQLGQQLQQGAQAHGLDLGGLLGSGGLGRLRDPGTLAQVAEALQRQQPGLLGTLLGGGRGA